MKILKWIFLVLGSALVVLQFIRPEKNIAKGPSASNITGSFAVSEKVLAVLQRSCYDCHSNNTVYPWYAEIQPVGWYLNKHIQDAKRGLNYDEYLTYRLMKQYRRFNDVIEKLGKDEMPLPSYLLIHRYAKLAKGEKDELVQWCTAMRDSMKAKFPFDSLERKPKR